MHIDGVIISVFEPVNIQAQLADGDGERDLLEKVVLQVSPMIFSKQVKQVAFPLLTQTPPLDCSLIVEVGSPIDRLQPVFSTTLLAD